MADQGLAGVFRVGDHVEGTTGGQPAGEPLDQLGGHLGAFAVLPFRTPLLGAVEADQQGEGQAPIGIPGERQPDRGNHPVVAEGEEALAVLRTPLSVGRGMGVVVHGRAEQVGAALVTERVVQDQRDLRGQPRQQEMEQPLTEGVDRPASVR